MDSCRFRRLDRLIPGYRLNADQDTRRTASPPTVGDRRFNSEGSLAGIRHPTKLSIHSSSTSASAPIPETLGLQRALFRAPTDTALRPDAGVRAHVSIGLTRSPLQRSAVRGEEHEPFGCAGRTLKGPEPPGLYVHRCRCWNAGRSFGCSHRRYGVCLGSKLCRDDIKVKSAGSVRTYASRDYDGPAASDCVA